MDDPHLELLAPWNLPRRQSRGGQSSSNSQLIYCRGQPPIQEGVLHPFLKCPTKAQVNYVLDEIHKGIYGFHSRRRTMVARSARLMPHQPLPRQGTTIDCHIMALLNMGHGHPWTLPKSQRASKILACRHRLLHEVDRGQTPCSNHHSKGPKFVSKTLCNFYEHLKITHNVTSVEHPQANGQVKAANKVNSDAASTEPRDFWPSTYQASSGPTTAPPSPPQGRPSID
ncbi:hypothetical protein CR513_53842, partial [Mucuna pruriens]